MTSDVEAMQELAIDPPGGDEEAEARRLKSIAEAKFASSNIGSALKYAKKAQRVYPELDGLDSMVTALTILLVAAEGEPDRPGSNFIDYYKVLQLEPFSRINSVRKQFKKLALDLHPDKSSFCGCEEAFKIVGEGYKMLSDKIRREGYDSKLRIRLQENVGVSSSDGDLGTFWCACSRCMLEHQFEKKYLGHNLVCPSCKMSFVAVEVEHVDQEDGDNIGESLGTRIFRSERLRKKAAARGGKLWDFGWRKGPSIVGTVVRSSNNVSQSQDDVGNHLTEQDIDVKRNEKVNDDDFGKRDKVSVGSRRKNDSDLAKVESKRAKFDDETMTLAELQTQMLQMVKTSRQKKKVEFMRLNEVNGKVDEICDHKKEKDTIQNGTDLNCTVGTQNQGTRSSSSKKSRSRLVVDGGCINECVSFNSYDFGRDRTAKCFRKGQVWAICDNDNGGMPRHYGLIDEVVSVNPFQVKLSWLDLQRNERHETTGRPVSCGRFEVTNQLAIKSLDMFSHVVNCERAAKNSYRIYPSKGSVWALYGEPSSMNETATGATRDKRTYCIGVFLTTYSDVHGVSMAYLERVRGYNSLFKRRDVGCKAIRMLGKDDIPLISHQIPARIVAGDGSNDLSKTRWELDTASLCNYDYLRGDVHGNSQCVTKISGDNPD